MTKKSKFKSFILSTVPGLGHIYQGFTNRGAIFMGALICIIFLMEFLQNSRGNQYGLFRFNLMNNYKNILELSIPLIWAASIIDNLVLSKKLDSENFSTELEDGKTGDQLNELTAKSNRQLVAILLSLVPGAGHIYLGLKNKGLQLTCYFFSLYFLSQLISIDLLNIPAALLWLYSILDTINIKTYTQLKKEEKDLYNFDDSSSLFTIKNKFNWIGGILIFTGVLIIVNRAAVDYIDPEILRIFSVYLKEGIVSIVLIVLGIKTLLGSKKEAA